METKERILIIDILRGFALLLIVLIHSVEHFEFFKNPEFHFFFSPSFDSEVMRTVTLLVRGKAYSIFALLFGLSFFIQMNTKEKKGIDYRYSFLWRMVILLIIGFIHSLIYRGDILHIYALLSFAIIFLYKVNTKLILILAILLMIQIPFIYQIVQSFIDPSYKQVKNYGNLFHEANKISAFGNLYDVISFNVWKGRKIAWLWTYYNGRYLQLIALFIIGMLLGRRHFFTSIVTRKMTCIWVLSISVFTFIILKYMNIMIQSSDLSSVQKILFNKLLFSYANLVMTFSLISLVILLYIKFQKGYLFKLFVSYGKMSLTNYITQAVFGVIFFYGFGLAMYKYLGTTWSLLFGLIIFWVQAMVSDYWNKTYYYGPIEWLWRCLTDLNFKIRFKRIKKLENTL